MLKIVYPICCGGCPQSFLVSCIAVTDASSFRIKYMKATAEQILSAADDEMCDDQAEKLCIIRSHLDTLELCRLNLESVILSTAEKYLP